MTDQDIQILLAPVVVTAAFAVTGLLLRRHILRKYRTANEPKLEGQSAPSSRLADTPKSR
ncbi:hypothetical protein RPMA_17120 [Tardiphaga alba]|uniref:Cellulose biosynthesis protein BcsF n=1 Tax=Tardiphaga alba TaxID=340268 RepID=A0ABX8ADH4_9BRAD|nr:hypothetical protein [Tardiphaga alba]QUS40365.1 hypothetical protein RPMA_17120 [Tardiphaga alba]